MSSLFKPLVSSILCGFVLLGASQVATAATSAQSLKATQKVSFLSTLLAKTGDIQKTTHGYRLILMNVDSRMLWFADRPKRLAGFTSTTNFIENWKNYFKTSNPNAAVVHVKLTSRQGFVEAPVAVEIANPLLINNKTLIFDVKPLGRDFSLGMIKLPVLFIDGASNAEMASPAAVVGAGAIVGSGAAAGIVGAAAGAAGVSTDGASSSVVENTDNTGVADFTSDRMTGRLSLDEPEDSPTSINTSSDDAANTTDDTANDTTATNSTAQSTQNGTDSGDTVVNSDNVDDNPTDDAEEYKQTTSFGPPSNSDDSIENELKNDITKQANNNDNPSNQNGTGGGDIAVGDDNVGSEGDKLTDDLDDAANLAE